MNLIVEDKVIVFPESSMSEQEFFDFCMANPDLNMERDKHGNIEIMSPVHFNSGDFESEVNFQLRLWNKKHESGYALSSATGFTLPNGAVRVPDAAWISRTRMDILPASEREKFAHICPDFVVEIRSKTDRLPVLQQKMEEYIDNGCRLGFLIDPYEQKAFVYKPGSDAALVTDFEQSLSGEDVLPGFLLELNSFRL